MNRKLKPGLYLHTYVSIFTGETVYLIYDDVGAVFDTIFPDRLERFYEAA